MIVLAAGLLVRLVSLDVPPLGFHPARQYRSALIARANSPAAQRAFSPAERVAARRMAQAQEEIEPEIMEAVAVAAYGVIGREDLRAPRLVSILAWLVGAVSMTWLLRLAGTGRTFEIGAMVFTLFAPFGVDASRAFMPDPLMVGLTMAALALTFRHHCRPSAFWAVLRVIVAGAAIYVKPMAGFVIAPAVLALDVTRLGAWRGLLVAGLTMATAAVPGAAHYVTLIASGNPVAENRIFLDLWMRPAFWARWLERMREVAGIPALALSAAGLWFGRGALRLLLSSTWAGYAVMGLLFTHHVSTHDYYSLPLVPLAGASLAYGTRALTLRFPSYARGVAVAAILIIGLTWLPALTSRGYYGDVARARQAAADYERIGDLTHHSARVVSLDLSYGFALAYHARIVTLQLPLSYDLAIADLTGRSETSIARLAEFKGEYFIGTDRGELDAQPGLRDLLEQRHQLLDRGGASDDWRYVVYDLTGPRVPDAPAADSSARQSERPGNVRIE